MFGMAACEIMVRILLMALTLAVPTSAALTAPAGKSPPPYVGVWATEKKACNSLIIKSIKSCYDILHKTAGAKSCSSTFKPISYKCNDRNSNTIEFTKENIDGCKVKVIADFKAYAVSNILVLHSYAGESYTTVYSGLPILGSTEERDIDLSKAEKQSYELKNFCGDPDPTIRDRYQEILDRNRRTLENASP